MIPAFNSANFCRGLAFLSLSLVACSLSPIVARAADYQRCAPVSSCIIGEFLFDDDYVPITDATCTLNSYDPDGNLFLNLQPLTPTSDGFYAHTLNTTGQTLGFYRSQICCTDNDDYLCLDKSFVIADPNLSAEQIQEAVWNAQTNNFQDPGSFGAQLGDLSNLTPDQIAEAVYNATASAYNTPGSFGELLQNFTVANFWSYSSRTLTGFGDLVQNIWEYSARSLTSFGDLIANIWDHSDRSLTDVDIITDGLATKTDIEDQTTALQSQLNTQTGDINSKINTQTTYLEGKISNQTTTLSTTLNTFLDQQGIINYQNTETLKEIAREVSENRELLEVLVNQPIVQSFIEEGDTPDLSAKIDKTKTTADTLYAKTQSLNSKVGLIALKWDSLNLSSLTTEISDTLTLLGDSQNPPESTIQNLAQWINKAWGGPLGEELVSVGSQTHTSLSKAKSHLELGQPAKALEQIKLAVDLTNSLDGLIGDLSNDHQKPTLYGKIAQVTLLAQQINDNETGLITMLSAWQTLNPVDKTKSIEDYKSKVLGINSLPQGKQVIDKDSGKPEVRQKNQVLRLLAVNNVNRLILARDAGVTTNLFWLEEGSIIFKLVLTNPSSRLTQTVPVNYALPKEVKSDDIIKTDTGLTVAFDPEKDALVAKGEFELAPLETQTLSIEVVDIWSVSTSEIESLRTQAGEILATLKDTVYFGQGATLKSDIDVILDKTLDRQARAITPESRIRIYRESKIELAGAQAKLDALKELATSAGSSSSLFGFIGGIQLVSVLGIVGIFVAGFVFLTLYMRFLKRQDLTVTATPTAHKAATQTISLPLSFPWTRDTAYLKKRGRPKGVTLPKIRPTSIPRSHTRLFHLAVIGLSASIMATLTANTYIYLNSATPPLTKGGLGEVFSGTENSGGVLVGTQNSDVVLTETEKPKELNSPPPGSVAGTQNTLPLNKASGTSDVRELEGVESNKPSTLASLSIPQNSSVNLHEHPSLEAKVITRLTQNQPVRVLSEEEGWVKIELDLDDSTYTGWLAHNFITFN
jgi:hypothetical protein